MFIADKPERRLAAARKADPEAFGALKEQRNKKTSKAVPSQPKYNSDARKSQTRPLPKNCKEVKLKSGKYDR